MSAQEARTWKDVTGGFSVEASLISQDDAFVSLKTVEGRVIKVPKEKLSQSDRDFLASRYVESKAGDRAKPTAQAAESMLTARLNGPTIAVKDGETLSRLLRQTGVPVFIDRASLSQLGVTPDIAVNANVLSSSLGEQLDAALGPLELTWYRLRTVLVVTTKNSSTKNALEALAYRIPIPRNDASSVLTSLQSVEPDSWESLGGSGSAVVLPGVVMIRQTGEIHRRLTKQLGVQSIPHRYLHPMENKMVTIRVTNGTVEDFAKQLGAQLNTEITLPDSHDDLSVMSVDLANVSAANALDLVLGQIEYEWLENQKGLELVPRAYARDLVEQRHVTLPNASPQTASLFVNAIMKLVEPRSWTALGGSGKIAHSGGKSFQVSQTQATFRKLSQLIADLGN